MQKSPKNQKKYSLITIFNIIQKQIDINFMKKYN